jgi:hypothetical protein
MLILPDDAADDDDDSKANKQYFIFFIEFTSSKSLPLWKVYSICSRIA